MRYYKVKFLEKPRHTKTELEKLMGTKVPVYDAETGKIASEIVFGDNEYRMLYREEIKYIRSKIDMKSKWNLISSIVQLVFGILAVIAFIILAINGEIMTKWIITLLLAIAFIIIGIIGIVDYKSQK